MADLSLNFLPLKKENIISVKVWQGFATFFKRRYVTPMCNRDCSLNGLRDDAGPVFCLQEDIGVDNPYNFFFLIFQRGKNIEQQRRSTAQYGAVITIDWSKIYLRVSRSKLRNFVWEV